MKLFTLILIIPLGVTGVKCPDELVIKPCSCKDSEVWGSSLECTNFDELEDLQKVFDNSMDYSFDLLSLRNCVVPYLNTTWFSTKKFNALIVLGLTLIDLFDNVDIDLPLLLKIEIVSTKILRGLRWQQFRPLKKLKYMRFVGIKMKKLSKEFRNNVPSSLEELYMYEGILETLKDEDFQGMTKLKKIYFNSNRIKVLKSSFFTDQRNILQELSFRKNPIESLPEDLFEGMSSLYLADFYGAQIKTLSTNLFPQILRIHFEFSDNPLVCDCKMSWIPKKSQDIDLLGTCDYPPNLKSRDLKDLTREDFRACDNYLKYFAPSVLLTNVSLYFEYFLKHPKRLTLSIY